MSDFEVPEAIICSSFEEPAHHWYLAEGETPEKRPGRRPSLYYYPDKNGQDAAAGARAAPKGTAIELKLVNLIRRHGQPHDYVPDFIVRFTGDAARRMILEAKGYDELAEVKAAAAARWVSAVNADGRHGRWEYAMARKMDDVRSLLDRG